MTGPWRRWSIAERRDFLDMVRCPVSDPANDADQPDAGHRTGTHRSAIRRLPIRFSTGWSTMRTGLNSRANRCAESAARKMARRTREQHGRAGFSSAGCGARDLKRRPLSPHPTPWLKYTEWLTDADHFRIMKEASVASLRYDRHQRRNADRHHPGIVIGIAGIRSHR